MLVVCSVLKEDLTQLLHVNAEAKDKTQISSSFVKIVLDIQASKYIQGVFFDWSRPEKF